MEAFCGCRKVFRAVFRRCCTAFCGCSCGTKESGQLRVCIPSADISGREGRSSSRESGKGDDYLLRYQVG